MDVFFNKLLGVHAKAIDLQLQRANLIASNLSNADTPNYKARDIDFQSLLQAEYHPTEYAAIAATDDNHITSADSLLRRQYRVPTQASLDGNTVETQIEKTRFIENALRYQVTTQLIGGKFNGFIKALTGE